MDSDKQQLLKLLYNTLSMCSKQNLNYEHFLINMTIESIEKEVPKIQQKTIPKIKNSDSQLIKIYMDKIKNDKEQNE